MQRVTQPAWARSKRAGASAAPTDRWWSRTARSRSGTRVGDEQRGDPRLRRRAVVDAEQVVGHIQPEAPVRGPVEVADPSRVIGHRGHPDPERVGREDAAWRLCHELPSPRRSTRQSRGRPPAADRRCGVRARPRRRCQARAVIATGRIETSECPRRRAVGDPWPALDGQDRDRYLTSSARRSQRSFAERDPRHRSRPCLLGDRRGRSGTSAYSARGAGAPAQTHPGDRVAPVASDASIGSKYQRTPPFTQSSSSSSMALQQWGWGPATRA